MWFLCTRAYCFWAGVDDETCRGGGGRVSFLVGVRRRIIVEIKLVV